MVARVWDNQQLKDMLSKLREAGYHIEFDGKNLSSSEDVKVTCWTDGRKLLLEEYDLIALRKDRQFWIIQYKPTLMSLQ